MHHYKRCLKEGDVEDKLICAKIKSMVKLQDDITMEVKDMAKPGARHMEEVNYHRCNQKQSNTNRSQKQKWVGHLQDQPPVKQQIQADCKPHSLAGASMENQNKNIVGNQIQLLTGLHNVDNVVTHCMLQVSHALQLKIPVQKFS